MTTSHYVNVYCLSFQSYFVNVAKHILRESSRIDYFQLKPRSQAMPLSSFQYRLLINSEGYSVVAKQSGSVDSVNIFMKSYLLA